MRVIIIGGGVVGDAGAAALSNVGHEVVVVDASAARREVLATRGRSVRDAVPTIVDGDVVLLCVPTPAGEDGFDLRSLAGAANDVSGAIAEGATGVIVAVRSTVPPGTTTEVVGGALRAAGRPEVSVAALPEFLRQATAEDDAMAPWMTVIGCADPAATDRLVAMLAPLGGDLRTYADPAVAEAVKLVHNTFNAAKISFFNEIGTLLDRVGVPGDVVAEAVVRSAEAARNPDYGTRPGRPFEGACLPKDLDGLLAWAAVVGAPVPMHEAVRAVNRSFTSPDCATGQVIEGERSPRSG